MQERERAFAEKIRSIVKGVSISDPTFMPMMRAPNKYLGDANNTIKKIRQNKDNSTTILNDTLLLCAQLGCLERYDGAKAGNRTINALLTEISAALSEKITSLESTLSETEVKLQQEKTLHEKTKSDSSKTEAELHQEKTLHEKTKSDGSKTKAELHQEKTLHEKTKSDSKTRKERLHEARDQESVQTLELTKKSAAISDLESTIKLKDAKIEQLGEELRRVTREMDAHRLQVRNYEETIANNLKYRNVLKYFEEQLLVDPRDKIDCKFELMTEAEMLSVMSGLKKHLASHSIQFNAADLLREARAKYTFSDLSFFPRQLPGPIAHPTPYITLEDEEPSKAKPAPVSEQRLVAVTNRRTRGIAFPDDSTDDNPAQARRVGAVRTTLSPRSNGK